MNTEPFQSGINAPYVSASTSSLDRHDTVYLHLSIDAKNTWVNGIFHNSRFAILRISSDFIIECIASSGMKRLRKTRAKSQEDAIAKINIYLQEQIKSP